jgi:uncharacterized membrane protein YphA (DoxX/SURF4 family)
MVSPDLQRPMQRQLPDAAEVQSAVSFPMEVRMANPLSRRSSPSLWTILVSLTFAAAGIAKLIPLRAEEDLFKSWGWTRRDMQTIGASELGGAALLLTGLTRPVGAMLLTSSSICILLTELRHNDDRLVTARSGLLAAAVSLFAAR